MRARQRDRPEVRVDTKNLSVLPLSSVKPKSLVTLPLHPQTAKTLGA